MSKEIIGCVINEDKFKENKKVFVMKTCNENHIDWLKWSLSIFTGSLLTYESNIFLCEIVV